MRIAHATDAADASFGGLYTATRGWMAALARAPGVESVSLAGRDPDWREADLCHAHGMWSRSAWVTLDWRLRHGRPLVVAPHGMLDEWALRRRALAKRLALATYEGLRLRMAACIHALCEAELDSVRRLGLSVPTFVVPNGVDIPSGDETSRMPSAGRTQRKILLYLGRIHPKKGLDLVLRALAALAARDRRVRDEWRLEVCGPGDGAYIDALSRMASELGIADIVDFRGPVGGDEKGRTLASASAFVLASHSEGLPMSVLEAWANGLPSLVSNECNLSGPAREGAAFLTSTALPEVTERLGELLDLDDRDRAAMGSRAREYVRRVHDWERVRDRMMDVYRWALGGGPRPEAS
jgi:poly(glycerol-phosphate) alpha-glucosyltransferase